MRRKVVCYQPMFKVWVVWDRDLLIERGQFVHRWQAEMSAAQLELQV